MFLGCNSASNRREAPSTVLGNGPADPGYESKGYSGSGIGPEPSTVRARLLPGDADHPINLRHLRIAGSPFQDEADEIDSSAFDKARIGLNGAIAGISLGSTFGTFFAFNKMLSHPGTRRLAAAGPLTASVASVCLDKFLRAQGTARLGDPLIAERSVPPEPSWVIDAIFPATLIANAYAFLLARIPSAPPRSLRGAATTVAITTWGSVLAGAFTELAVQEKCGRGKRLGSRPVVPQGGPASPRIRSVSGILPESGPPSIMQRSIGLAITQLPVVFFHVMNAAGRVPARFMLAGPAIGMAPLILQRVTVERLTGLSAVTCMPDPEMRGSEGLDTEGRAAEGRASTASDATVKQALKSGAS